METNVTRCAIWYHLYNLKNVKNTHRVKVTLLHGCFSCFLICTNNTKSRNVSKTFFLLDRTLFLSWANQDCFSKNERKTKWVKDICNLRKRIPNPVALISWCDTNIYLNVINLSADGWNDHKYQRMNISITEFVW